MNAVSFLNNGTLSILQPFSEVSQSDVLLVDAVGLQYKAQLSCTEPSQPTIGQNAASAQSMAATTAFHGQLLSRTSSAAVKRTISSSLRCAEF